MRRLPCLALALVVAAILRPLAAGQAAPPSASPDAVIEKYIAAIGGRDALRAVTTMMVRGRNVGLGSEDRPLIRYLKQPHLLRQQDAPGAAVCILADGQRVYQESAAGRVEVTQPWARALLHETIDGNFLDGARLGIRYQYVGLEGTKTGPWTFHHLRRVFADGYVEDLYFESESGLLRKVIEDNGRATRVYYEYRPVGGIRYAHLRATVFEGGEPPHLFVVDEVKVNPVLDDAFFRNRSARSRLPSLR